MATQLAEQIEAPDGGTTFEADDEGQSAPRDFEAEARAHGWTPKEDFRGDASRWVDAETFVTRADEIMPLLKKQLQTPKSEMAQDRRTIKRLVKAEADVMNALADLKAKAEAAVESGDLAAFRKVDGQIETLRKEAAADAGDPTGGEDPQEAYDAFREANVWYDKGNLGSATEIEVEARMFADRLADKYVRQGLQSEVTPSEFFARIAKETAEKFPLLTARKTRDKPVSPVAGVTTNGGSRNAKIGANLPPEAKDHAERFMRMGIYKDCKTKAEAHDRYAKDYTWPVN